MAERRKASCSCLNSRRGCLGSSARSSSPSTSVAGRHECAAINLGERECAIRTSQAPSNPAREPRQTFLTQLGSGPIADAPRACGCAASALTATSTAATVPNTSGSRVRRGCLLRSRAVRIAARWRTADALAGRSLGRRRGGRLPGKQSGILPSAGKAADGDSDTDGEGTAGDPGRTQDSIRVDAGNAGRIRRRQRQHHARGAAARRIFGSGARLRHDQADVPRTPSISLGVRRGRAGEQTASSPSAMIVVDTNVLAEPKVEVPDR